MAFPDWLRDELARRGIDPAAPNLGATDPASADEPTGIVPCICREGCPACDDTGVIYP